MPRPQQWCPAEQGHLFSWYQGRLFDSYHLLRSLQLVSETWLSREQVHVCPHRAILARPGSSPCALLSCTGRDQLSLLVSSWVQLKARPWDLSACLQPWAVPSQPIRSRSHPCLSTSLPGTSCKRHYAKQRHNAEAQGREGRNLHAEISHR